MITVPYIVTAQGVSVFFDNDHLMVHRSDRDYNKLIAQLRDPNTTDADIRPTLVDIRDRLTQLIDEQKEIGGPFTMKDNVVYHRGAPLNGYMSDKLTRMLDEGWDLTPIGNFLDKLELNPSHRVRNDLYSFLEYGNMPLTADGDFLAYKYVNNDYMDCHSRTIYNGVGHTIEMPRREVDDNPNRTCSAGLHVCSYDYLPAAQNGGVRIMCCKINPADVVAIPTDYNNTKMRVCRYVVVSELTNTMIARGENNNVLTERAVFDDDYDPDSDYEDPNDDLYHDSDDTNSSFRVEGKWDDNKLFECIDEFLDYEEARQCAYDIFKDYDTVRIIRKDYQVVLQLSVTQ